MNLREMLEQEIANGGQFGSLHDILRSFAIQGGTRAQAQRTLNDMRGEGRPESADDLLLELLDVASGFCQPKWRLWPNEDGESHNP
jgi:hypothetical protein